MIEDADLANTLGPSTDIAAGGNSGPDREPAAAAAGPLAMSEDAFVPVAECARSRGVSAQATRNAITSGRISGEAFTVDVRGHYLIRPLAAKDADAALRAGMTRPMRCSGSPVVQTSDPRGPNPSVARKANPYAPPRY